MNFLRNKYFLLGVLLLLAIAIPVTIYFVQQQQDLRSRAAPSSSLTFSPPSQTVAVGDEFTVDVTIDPGQNIVSFVQFDATFDPQYLEAVHVEVNEAEFPIALEGPNIGAGSAQLAVGIGGPRDGNAASGAVQSALSVATITFRALAETASAPAQIDFSPTDTEVLSLSVNDQPGENVLSNRAPAKITILAGADVSPSPSVTPQVSPSVSPPVSPSPTQAPNQAPQCTSLVVSPATSGVAPFTVNFTSQGSDDGLIVKATYNFGDGDIQDIFDGLNAPSVTNQVSHTYLNEGSYTASVTFTDDNDSISQACTQIIQVGPGGGGDGNTGSGSAATSTPLPTKPPIDNPGGIFETVAIASGVLVTIVGGILIFAL